MALVTTDQERQNALALIEKKHKEKRVVSIGKLVTDIKTSTFFKQNWDDLLYAAPNCLELLGTCTTVSASHAASGITLTKPLSGKFVYLQYDTLKGCLAQISNDGLISFQVADRGMASISQNCLDVKSAVARIIDGLQSMDAPISSITGNMEDLKMYSGKCRDTAKEIHNSFDGWQKVTMELWASCNNESAVVEAKQKQIEEKLAFADTTAKEQTELVKDVKEQVKRMENRVDECKKDYKDTLDAFPGAGTFLGQAIALSLTDALGNAAVVGTSVIAQSAAMASNPMYAGNQLAQAAGRFGPQQQQPTVVVVGGNGQQASPQNGQQQQQLATVSPAGDASAAPPVTDPAAATAAQKRKEGALSTLRNAFSGSKAFKKAVPTKPATNVAVERSGDRATEKNGEKAVEKKSSASAAQKKDISGKFIVNDPAMTVINIISTFVDGVKALVVDPNTGDRAVDWDKIIPAAPKEGEKAKVSPAATFKYSLERKQRDFAPDPKGLASQLTVRILSESLAVVNEILEEAKKANSLNEWVRPGAESELVKSWDERISVCADTAVRIKQAANSTPGSVAGGIASIFPKKSEAEMVASNNLKANMAEQTIRAATTKLTSAQEVYKNTLATYTTMNEQANKLQQDLIRARAEVEQLKVQEVTTDNIKRVLVQCIGFLSQLKFKIGKLVDFFSSVSIFVESICDSQVRPFEREITNMIKENPGQELKAFRYNAFLRDTIFQLTLQIYASFSLFKDVAEMYRAVHLKCIGPGLELVDKCGESPPARAEKMTDKEKLDWDRKLNQKKKEMSDYCTKAQKDVREIVQNKQQELLSGLKAKIDAIDNEIGQFPAELRPTEEQKKALENGREIASNAAQEAALREPNATKFVTHPDSITDEDRQGGVIMDDD